MSENLHPKQIDFLKSIYVYFNGCVRFLIILDV
jgi:hypothetical protein